MYVCLGKHTYLDKKRYVCMYVCMSAWSKRTYLKSTGMYVSRIHRRVVHTQYVCMSGETDIPRKLEVCMVCMDVWGKIYT